MDKTYQSALLSTRPCWPSEFGGRPADGPSGDRAASRALRAEICPQRRAKLDVPKEEMHGEAAGRLGEGRRSSFYILITTNYSIGLWLERLDFCQHTMKRPPCI